MKRDKREHEGFRFGRMQKVIILYLILICILVFAQRNVKHVFKERLLSIREENAFTEPVEAAEGTGSLIIWQDDETGILGRTQMEIILDQMKIPCSTRPVLEFRAKELEGYETAVLAVTDISLMGRRCWGC